MNNFKKLFLNASPVLGLIVLGTQVSVVFAQTQPKAPIYDKPSLGKFLCSIINWFFWIIILLSVIMVLVAAFDYVTAGDDTEKTTRGRKRLTYAAVGIAIALLASGFPAIVASVFPGTNVSGTVSCLG